MLILPSQYKVVPWIIEALRESRKCQNRLDRSALAALTPLHIIRDRKRTSCEEILVLKIILAYFRDLTISRSTLEMLGPFQCGGFNEPAYQRDIFRFGFLDAQTRN